jgi:prepilin-type N-terminal cleavage/methylation domain-containing protein
MPIARSAIHRPHRAAHHRARPSCPGRFPGKRIGFTLIEMLTVTAIIAILMGMIGAATFAARQRAYQAQAQTEVRELAAALRSYWLTYGAWPPEVQAFNDVTAFKSASKDLLLSLMADPSMDMSTTGCNKRRIVFMQLGDKHFGTDNNNQKDVYLDPWGNAYEMAFAAKGRVARNMKFFSSVAFPMRDRNTPTTP